MKRTDYFFIIIAMMLLAACSKTAEFRDPSGDDKSQPAMLSDAVVQNIAGGAKISYKLPNDPGILYVKAVFTGSNGKEAEVKASYYTSSLVVQGFSDTNPHEVSLYTVSRNEVLSQPVKVEIKPLKAPIFKVLESVDLYAAFGGYNLIARNTDSANVALIILKKNDLNEWEPDNNRSIYTSGSTISSQIRGLEAVEQTVAYFVRDRWGNRTDTVFKSITPYFETLMDRSKYKPLPLPGDAPLLYGTLVTNMWDNKLSWPYVAFAETSPGPSMLTVDMGQIAQVSRIWWLAQSDWNRYYLDRTMKKFEIYGSANPNPNGALDDSWYLLGTYEIIKPSGLPYGTDNELDAATARAGFSCDVDLKAPKVRYIRFRSFVNFVGTTGLAIDEFAAYGDNR